MASEETSAFLKAFKEELDLIRAELDVIRAAPKPKPPISGGGGNDTDGF